jgi:arginyl-tRNA synthetase
VIAQHLPKVDFISNAQPSAPGFINLTLDPKWVAAQVNVIIDKGSSFANLDLGHGAKAQVEFVSANPTGPLSVGRGRGGVIGDTMANLLTAVGYNVTREYYFNNAGQQMRNLGDSLRVRYLQALGQSVEFPEEYYQGSYLIDLARDLAAKYNSRLANESWEYFKPIAEEAMFASIKQTLKRLNIEMDVFFNENSLYDDGSVNDVIAKLREAGYAYDNEGAVWFKTTAFGADEDRVIVKSSGDPTYRLPDIAYHRNKLNRGFDLIIDVLGSDHKDSFPDVLRGLQALGFKTDGIKLLMNQFVTVKGEKMSTRAGRFTTLDELIEEVGADVVRYFLLMRSAESHLEFDLDLAKEQSEKNPVYYVQYAHARICSILRKGEGMKQTGEGGDVSLLTHPSEQKLIRRMLELSQVIEACVNDLAPHPLTTYATDLAGLFHDFYRDCQVLPSETHPMDAKLSAARVRLVKAARIALATALGLVGVSAPEKM